KSPAASRRSVLGGEIVALLAILLNARRAQTSEAMLINRCLPGQELLDGQRVTRTSFLEGQQSATDRCDHLRFSADDPAFGRRRWQVRNSQRTTIWPDYIFDPRAMGFGHWYTHKTKLD